MIRLLFLSVALMGCGLTYAATSECRETGREIVPPGLTGGDIQRAIRQAPANGTVLLHGSYAVETSIQLRDGITLCSSRGAILRWSSQDRPGMMLDASKVEGVTILNLVLEGRGILATGRRHRIENNYFKGIQTPSNSQHRWGERHAILVADRGTQITITRNVFQNIQDTGVMAYGLNRSEISHNQFINTWEGIHAFSSQETRFVANSGSGFRAMALELQGQNRPGVVVEDNDFRNWESGHERSAFGMSVVSGQGAIVRRNRIESAGRLGAGIEIGGLAPQVTQNQLINGDLVITDAPDTVIDGNTLMQASIVKDVNRVRGGRLTISRNIIKNPPHMGIYTDQWRGYDEITIAGNTISKEIRSPLDRFGGILLTDTDKNPLLIQDNLITVKNLSSTLPVEVACLVNAGHQGNMTGTRIIGNTCDGGGIGVFSSSNAQGGHRGILYQFNKLMHLRQTITGDSSGLQSDRNNLLNVQLDSAGFGAR